ncbi:ABC transporter permease [Dissulfurispira thermophila]|uniref:ABC transporter permease n=2 Tax=root TaxID=1 RepID=A0A7G1H2I7_9BACT|nr:lipoprotein-releasing ABC transporter permease subunit [Dissulfurispira thermophila]BCB96878.1 ABC transporter permease [Dissulfurispira thermophila]
MNLPYQLFIALRYLKSKKKHRGISFNTVISISGVAVGVMALLVVLSVMSGFHEDLQKKILGANAHVVVVSYKGGIEDYSSVMEKLMNETNIVSMSPFVIGQVMVSAGKRAHGIFLRGIEPSSELKTTDILRHIKEGSIEEIITGDRRQKTEGRLPWIIIGRELASMLGVIAGDTINVISPVGEVGPLGMLPKVRRFKVVAVFEIGMFEYDTNLAFTDIRSAQEFFGYGNVVTGIQLRLDDIYKASLVRDSINKKMGFPYYARDWMQMNRNLFSALKLEKFAMFIILILIVLVASFNIVSTLMMNVMEKQKEIAILKAMGAKNQGIMMVFMFQGLLIGIVGTVIGVTGGYVLGKIINNYEIIKLPADVYYLSKLPVKMKLIDFIVVSFSAITISFLSTLYPSYYAAKLNPVEPLRYE